MNKSCTIRQPVTWLFLISFLISLLCTVSWTAAQGVDPPDRGEPIKSMGFEKRWKPHLGFMLEWDRRGAEDLLGGEAHLGVYRDFQHPIAGLLGLVGEGYFRSLEGQRPDGGARLMLASRSILLQLGADYSYRIDRIDFLLSLTPALRRGGLLGMGDNFRFDWIPNRGNSFRFGVELPLGQPYQGKTRPSSDHVELPKKGSDLQIAEPDDAELRDALARIEHAADWINRYTTPFFDQSGGDESSHIAEFEHKLAGVEEHFNLVDEVYPDGHTFTAEIDTYHREMRRAFALAIGGDGAGGDGAGADSVAAIARRVLLDDVILPYNRLLGQRKTRDSLLGFGRVADDHFRALVAACELVPPARRATTLTVFRRLILIMEENRQGARDIWRDSRFVWIPLHYAVRLQDHDTQPEIDALLERALERRLTEGNSVDYVINELFQPELGRMIHAAEDYHVLWIHDYRGLNSAGVPDEIAYLQATESYLQAMIDKARAYDETRRLPVYMVFLDQFYYESNVGRLFLALLANPLDYDLDLPDGFEEWEEGLQAKQEELRQAVAASAALQAGARAYGDDWLERRVKVHINITNPADFSFRSRHMVSAVPFLPDNIFRDHRKISFRDVTELDPGRGEAIFTGVGVGEHYSGPTWDDRSLLMRGPALVDLKTAARELLLSQGFDDDEIPPPLRPLPFPDDYDQRIDQLIAGGWTAPALQVHNATGYGTKQCNVVKGVLYELMPPGSHMYIPDSLWNSPLWAAMVTGAALRGCKVFPIAPAVENAPSAGLPQMSRANDVFTRFVVIRQRLEEEMAAAGGMLRPGIYNAQFDIGDVENRRREFSKNFTQTALLREIFPFDPSVFAEVERVADEAVASGFEPAYLAGEELVRKPKLHLKTQFFASAEAIETIVPLPEWRDVVRDYMETRAKQLRVRETQAEAREMRAALSESAGKLAAAWWSEHSAEQVERVTFYLTIGSQNQDYRGKIMDGEVLCVVAGTAAMIAYLDFVGTMTATTWVDDLEQLEGMLPRTTGFWSRLSRFITYAL
jgi:hypothetical protein